MLWLVVLGVIMGWVESAPVDINGHPVEHDWYAPLPEPPEYLSNRVLEPDDTPETCDKYVRYMAGLPGGRP